MFLFLGFNTIPKVSKHCAGRRDAEVFCYSFQGKGLVKPDHYMIRMDSQPFKSKEKG